MKDNVTVYVVDDDNSSRKALLQLLSSVGYIAEGFESSREFLKVFLDGGLNVPCCVILDVRMPGMSGLDLQEELSDTSFPPPVIFLTAHGDIPMAVRAMKNGAVDFLTKPYNDQLLLDVVNEAREISMEDQRERSLIAALKVRSDRLTPRERQVMALVITGILNKQIASELNISEKTVKVHRGHVMEKLEISSVAEMVRMAQKVGIEPGDIDA